MIPMFFLITTVSLPLALTVPSLDNIMRLPLTYYSYYACHGNTLAKTDSHINTMSVMPAELRFGSIVKIPDVVKPAASIY